MITICSGMKYRYECQARSTNKAKDDHDQSNEDLSPTTQKTSFHSCWLPFLSQKNKG